MSDPRSFDISNVNVRMRVNMLDRLQQITRFGTDDRIVKNCARLMTQIAQSIGVDISALDERPVLTLITTLTKIVSQRTGRELNSETLNLLNNVHNVVCDMAVENADLVET